MAKNNVFPLRMHDLFSPAGRISRLSYFWYNFLNNIFAKIVFYLTTYLTANEFKNEHMSNLIATSLLIPFVLLSLCLISKRLHDIGLPGFLSIFFLTRFGMSLTNAILPFYGYEIKYFQNFYILLFINILFLIIGLFLVFTPGQKKDNKYGQDPLM